MYRSHRFLVCLFFRFMHSNLDVDWSKLVRQQTKIDDRFLFLSQRVCVCVCVGFCAAQSWHAISRLRVSIGPFAEDRRRRRKQTTNKTKNKTKHKIERSRRFQGRRNSCVVTHKHSKKNDRNRHFFSPQKVVLLDGKAMESVL